MKSTADDDPGRSPNSKLLVSWLLLCTAIALHVLDEATHDFLGIYNPTVVVLREHMPWLPFPVFTFRMWIIGLAIAIALLFSLSPLVSRGVHWTRPVVILLAVLMIANGLGHTAGTVLGRTVASVHFSRPMPGFYSFPLLIAASIYVLIQLRKTTRAKLRT